MATSSYFKDLIEQLKAAALEARRCGDVATAIALETQIRNFEYGTALPSRLSSANGGGAAVDVNQVKALWAGAGANQVHSTKSVCVLDFGTRGSITFVGGAILITGSIALEPKTALMIGRHANKFHGGGGTVFGSPEFLFNVSVANALTGSKVGLEDGRKADATRVAETARHWRPLLNELDVPARPAPRISVPERSVPSTAA